MTTFLIYADVNAEKKTLKIATKEEWDCILKTNKGLPMNERRCFIVDRFYDNGELDCMYMEVSLEKYREWHSKHELAERRRVRSELYMKLSLDVAFIADGIEYNLYESLADDSCLEDDAMSNIIMEQLEEQLAEWKPWAIDMLHFYLAGEKRTCTKAMQDKYSSAERSVERWKKAFEKFVINYFEKDVGF